MGFILDTRNLLIDMTIVQFTNTALCMGFAEYYFRVLDNVILNDATHDFGSWCADYVYDSGSIHS